jgi:hypothetical protein
MAKGGSKLAAKSSECREARGEYRGAVADGR